MKPAIRIRLFNSFLRGNLARRLVVAHDSAALAQKLLPPPPNSSLCPASRTLRSELHWPHMLITDYNNRKAECLSMKLCLFEQFDIYSECLLESVHGNWMPVSCLRVLLHRTTSVRAFFGHVKECYTFYWLNTLKTINYSICESGWETINSKWPLLLVSGLGKIKNLIEFMNVTWNWIGQTQHDFDFPRGMYSIFKFKVISDSLFVLFFQFWRKPEHSGKAFLFFHSVFCKDFCWLFFAFIMIGKIRTDRMWSGRKRGGEIGKDPRVGILNSGCP